MEARSIAEQKDDSKEALSDLVLVSCVSKKRASPVPARDLYVSDLFRKARAYVEQLGRPWFVLSAKYGLVHPDEVIEPYDVTLNNMGTAKRRCWAHGVLTNLTPHLERVDSITFLAGQRYREFLEQPLRARGLIVNVPMRWLKIGEQLRWLNLRLDG